MVTFKDVEKLHEKLQKEGVDIYERTSPRHPLGPPVASQQQPYRVNILTYGNERSLNSFSHCKVVILLGIIRLSDLDIEAAIIAQKDDIRAEVSKELAKKVQDTELAYRVHQAIGRGSARKMLEGGQAAPMQVYIFDQDKSLRTILQGHLAGLQWIDQAGPDGLTDGGRNSATLVAARIAAYLSGLAPQIKKLSTRQVRADLELEGVPDRTLTRAVQEAVRCSNSWVVAERSLVRKEVAAREAFR